MSITRSTSVAQTDYRVLKVNCYLDYCFLLKHCETAQGKATMILLRYLSVRTKRARYTKELRSKRGRGGNMSVTRSIRVAQTDNSFLKEDRHVDHSL